MQRIVDVCVDEEQPGECLGVANDAEAADDVRRAAADAATQAARDLLMSDDSVDQFDRAVAEVDKSVG
ncbi:MAG: hypothetical protein AAFY43_03630 [Pseudomonadota bacterium]